ncbi:N-formylglutamate amidohydrolase [Sphingomonas cavernae]|uniref:N-formylglutamate amidohydrolase n=1 Tax=Sphingomonas cavernae TaxID=2320861 RepID=A0A418W881_9SPHN|nr:N-formylglutamate amidohydrolase [Sphingomonas cavernae]RJF86205.1 N-formylglutamate amidohydrolase [Sphingomonas cavernae]
MNDGQGEDTPWWVLRRGDGPVVATAIHDGHGLRNETRYAMLLPEADRLREEDPFTGRSISDVPVHVIAGRSRFEVDLNRARHEAVYRTTEQSWGLKIWAEEPDEALVRRSLAIHDRFYAMMRQLLGELEADFGRFVLLDVHSYNHRRTGPDGDPAPQAETPEINIGTFSMPRARWAWLLDPLIDAMRAFDFGGRTLDVRENIAFQGKGELARFVHGNFPESGCAIALEFKKFYMDEWTGKPDPQALGHMRAFINHVAATCRELLDGR